MVQKALNAIYGGVAFLVADANRAAAVKLIAEIDEIPDAIAARELDGNIKHLSRTGEMQLDWMERALDMAPADRHDGPGAGRRTSSSRSSSRCRPGMSVSYAPSSRWRPQMSGRVDAAELRS